MTDRIGEDSIEIITAMKVMTEAGTGLEKGHFPEAIVAMEIGVQAIPGPVRVDTNGYRFERCTMVSEIHENVDLVLGIKNVFELEGVIKFMRLLFQLPKQIPIHFSKRAYCAETKGTKIDQVKSTMYR